MVLERASGRGVEVAARDRSVRGGAGGSDAGGFGRVAGMRGRFGVVAGGIRVAVDGEDDGELGAVGAAEVDDLGLAAPGAPS